MAALTDKANTRRGNSEKPGKDTEKPLKGKVVRSVRAHKQAYARSASTLHKSAQARRAQAPVVHVRAPETSESEKIPATVLDNRLKQRWGFIFRSLNSKAAEAQREGRQELSSRLKDLASNFYPTKRGKVAPQSADQDYDKAFDAYENLGRLTKIVTSQPVTEEMVRDSEAQSRRLLNL